MLGDVTEIHSWTDRPIWPQGVKAPDHSKLIQLYRKARAIPGVKKIQIGSGLRYDLAVRSPEYVKELVTHHVGGLLKIAAGHIETDAIAVHVLQSARGRNV